MRDSEFDNSEHVTSGVVDAMQDSSLTGVDLCALAADAIPAALHRKILPPFHKKSCIIFESLLLVILI